MKSLRGSVSVAKRMMLYNSHFQHPTLYTAARCFSSVEVKYDVTKLHSENYWSVPKLPLPEIKDTLETYLTTIKPLCTEAEFENTKKLADEFQSSSLATELQNGLKLLDSAKVYPNSYIEKFWDEMYLGGRWPLMIHTNPFYILSRDEKNITQLDRAASFASSTVRWWNKVVKGNLEPDRERDGTPLCMYQFGQVLGVGRTPMLDQMDVLTRYPFSKHIIVLHKHIYYKVQVVDQVGQPLDSDTLKLALSEILNGNKVGKKEHDIGLLTTGGRNEYAIARSHIVSSNPANDSAFQAIDESLFVLVLDDNSNNSLYERSKLALHGVDGSNRFFDKHQIIAFADGELGINFEHACNDGLSWNRMLHEVINDIQGKDSGLSPLPSAVAGTAELEQVRFELDSKSCDLIRQAHTESIKQVNNLDEYLLEFNHFGRNEIKKWKMSPDGVAQMALQLSYNKLHGQNAATYEACSMKNWYHGRTETIRSCTVESDMMVKAFLNGDSDDVKRAALNAAVAKHIQKAVGARTCSGPDRGVDRHMYALKCVAAELGYKDDRLPALFADPVFARSSTWLMSTSNVTAPNLDIFGFGAVAEDGYGFGYMTGPDHLPIYITSFHSSSVTSSEKMGKALEETLLEFHKLYN